MTIKKTILGFMATALFISASVCQASELTVRRYNLSTDKPAVKDLFEKTIHTYVCNNGQQGYNHSVKEGFRETYAEFEEYINLDGAWLIQTNMGIQGYFILNQWTEKISINFILLQNEYINPHSFQRLFNEILKQVKLDSPTKIELWHYEWQQQLFHDKWKNVSYHGLSKEKPRGQTKFTEKYTVSISHRPRLTLYEAIVQ